MAKRSKEVICQYTDRYGDTRTIHRDGRGRLALKRDGETVIYNLCNTAGPLIGARIKAMRQRKGMSQRDLAIKSGLVGNDIYHKYRIHDIEQGQRGTVRFGTLYAFAFALDCEIYDLLPSRDELMANSRCEPVQVTTLARKAG